jgi:Tfp pilus assembly protein PilW
MGDRDVPMSSVPTRIGRRVRREEGFTLVELLATMVAGMVVLAAVVTVISVTLRQTSYTFTRVDATERARSALAHMEDELHSACIVNGVTPIEGGAQGSQDSDANDLVFVSQFGTSANPTPVEHKITYSPTAHTLTEYTYTVTGANPNQWVFSSSPTNTAGKRLLTNVSPIPISGSSNFTPIFQYFAYEPYTDANGNAAMMLMDGSSSVPGTTTVSNPDPLPVTPSGLSATNAASTAEVMVNLLVGAAGGNMENTNAVGTADPVTDSIVLRFTPPANAAGGNATFGPCA